MRRPRWRLTLPAGRCPAWAVTRAWTSRTTSRPASPLGGPGCHRRPCRGQRAGQVPPRRQIALRRNQPSHPEPADRNRGRLRREWPGDGPADPGATRWCWCRGRLARQQGRWPELPSQVQVRHLLFGLKGQHISAQGRAPRRSRRAPPWVVGMPEDVLPCKGETMASR